MDDQTGFLPSGVMRFADGLKLNRQQSWLGELVAGVIQPLLIRQVLRWLPWRVEHGGSSVQDSMLCCLWIRSDELRIQNPTCLSQALFK